MRCRDEQDALLEWAIWDGRNGHVGNGKKGRVSRVDPVGLDLGRRVE